MAKKLPSAKDWKAREIKDWNATTFRSYLAEKVEEKYGVPYVTNSIPKEAAAIKRMSTDHGPEVLKDFIDACLKEYRSSNPMYPYPNFMFMYSFMREKWLPKVILDRKQQETKNAAEHTSQSLSTDEALEWL
jgi:hypothetical protein